MGRRGHPQSTRTYRLEVAIVQALNDRHECGLYGEDNGGRCPFARRAKDIDWPLTGHTAAHIARAVKAWCDEEIDAVYDERLSR